LNCYKELYSTHYEIDEKAKFMIKRNTQYYHYGYEYKGEEKNLDEEDYEREF